MRPLKDSGVEWLGEIPEDWLVKPLKRNTYIKARVGWKGLTSDEFEVESYAYLVTGRDFSSKVIDFSECYQVSQERYLDDPFIQLKQGDILITKDGTIGKTAWVNELDKPACLNSGIFVVRPKADYVSEFLFWVLESAVFKEFIRLVSSGSTIQHLYQNVFENFSFGIPPVEEQRLIADFLDRETAKIDALIAKQEQLITTLDERRGAVLRTLVTRGYREDVALKPASAPWLYGALIPAHWVEAPLSTFLTLKSGSSITSESIEEEGDYPVFGGGGFRGYTDMFTNEGDFVLIGRVGALCGNIKRATGKFYASEHSLVSYPKVPMSQGWLAAILETMNVGQYSKASAQPVISVGGIGRVKAPFPPHEEQLAIDSKLQEAIASIEALSVRTAATVALLKERRQGLISAAVTGKLEVVV